jgi:Ca2+-binding EF-hand superfamily protein
MDNSGRVELSEFMIGAVDERVVFTQERLATAFKYFDKDGGGDISAEEIHDRLGYRPDITAEIAESIMD